MYRHFFGKYEVQALTRPSRSGCNPRVPWAGSLSYIGSLASHRMSTLFAMAGLAEAAFARGLVLEWFVLLVALLLALIAWWKRSWVAITLACCACLLVGALFDPWRAFRHPEFPNDSDEIYWLIRFRIAAVAWFVLSAGGMAGLVLVIRRNRRLYSVCPK